MCPAWDIVTPVRNAVQYQSLAEILYHGQPSVTPPHYAGAPIAEYTVQSFLQQSNGKGYDNLLGEILRPLHRANTTIRVTDLRYTLVTVYRYYLDYQYRLICLRGARTPSKTLN